MFTALLASKMRFAHTPGGMFVGHVVPMPTFPFLDTNSELAGAPPSTEKAELMPAAKPPRKVVVEFDAPMDMRPARVMMFGMDVVAIMRASARELVKYRLEDPS